MSSASAFALSRAMKLLFVKSNLIYIHITLSVSLIMRFYRTI